MDGLPLANHMFEAKLVDVLNLCEARNQGTRAKVFLTEMQKCIVEWKSPDTTAEVTSISFALLTEVRLSEKHRVGRIHWGLPPSLYDALSDPRRWATIDLAIMAKLSSYTAVALYEICSKFRDNFNGLTSRNSAEWWSDALSGSSPTHDAGKGVFKKREWRKVKSESVQDAIQEINTKTDLIIELLEHKGPRGVVAEVQFKIIKKSDKKLEAESDHQSPVNSDITLYADRLGVTNKTALKAMVNEYGNEDLFSSLQKLEQRQKQVNLPIVMNPQKYLNSLIGNQRPQEISTIKTEVPIQNNLLSALEKPAEPSKSWLAIRRQDIFDEIMTLNESEQRKWVNKCVERFREAGILTSSIKQRALNSVWGVGVLKSSVVEIYAQETYGPDWDKPDLSEKEEIYDDKK